MSIIALLRCSWALFFEADVASQTICTTCAMPLAVGLFMLLAWNMWLLINNKTTIEYHEVSPPAHAHTYNTRHFLFMSR